MISSIEILSKLRKKKQETVPKKTSSVPLGTPLKRTTSKFTKIHKYIKDRLYRFRLRTIGFLVEYQVQPKFFLLLELTLNVLITGLLAWYAINYDNFIAYGLRLALVVYYTEMLIDKIKEKPFSQDKS